jgi:glycerol uptake facilitator-like aquaporin
MAIPSNQKHPDPRGENFNFRFVRVPSSTGPLRSEAVPVAVGLYITGAYWFTASTSFANPAVTLARAFTDTFAGIRPSDRPAFLVLQLLGAIAAEAADHKK